MDRPVRKGRSANSGQLQTPIGSKRVEDLEIIEPEGTIQAFKSRRKSFA